MKKKRNDDKSSLETGNNAIKCVVVGDGTVGSMMAFIECYLFYLKLRLVNSFCFQETCLLLTYSTNKFPTEYVPTVFDNYAVDLVIAEKSYTLALFDTGNNDLRSLFNIK